MNDLEFEEPNWQGHEPSESEHDVGLNIQSFMANCSVQVTRLNLLAPFACNPEQKYVAGCVYLDNRGWHIEGREYMGDSKTGEAALNALAEWIEVTRQAQLEREFRESGI